VKRFTRTSARPFRPNALTWIDFLVIAAIVLTVGVTVTSAVGHARASDLSDPPTFSTEPSRVAHDPDLIKAKIRLAIGSPWR
jgi:hypothetical protein